MIRKAAIKQKQVRSSGVREEDQDSIREKLKALQLLEKESISSQQKIMNDSGL